VPEKQEVRTVILAAGKGKRMKSDLAKVLHTLRGKPLLSYAVSVATALDSNRIVVIIGHQAERIRDTFAGEGLIFIDQREQLGTGHAVLQAQSEFCGYTGTVLILCGDVPLLSPDTARSLVDLHRMEGAAVTVLTTVLMDPSGYGRVVKGEQGEVVRIVEDRDATENERQIREINTGIYCVDGSFLFAALPRITNNNVQGEYYLTDIVHIARSEGRAVRALIASDAEEVMGVNTPDDLARASLSLERRISKTPAGPGGKNGILFPYEDR
jgi:UDP-N-acetylglucosamine diphosphorylase/glucosamine-1-phosphate N-acetyltransferase